MKNYFYYRALRKTIIQFLDVFNDIKIYRERINKYITVPLKFAYKSKTWFWINERKNDEVLPMMSAYITSISYAPDRTGNKLHNILKSSSPSANSRVSFPNPVPYNVDFSLNIWSKNTVDVDQILEQILPYFSPYINARMNISDLNLTYDMKILFNGCSPDITGEFSDEERRIILWNLDFTCQTYMFKPTTTAKPILKIITKYYTDETLFDAYVGTESTYTSGASGYEAESSFIKAYPPWYDDDGDILYTYENFGDN
jgi:hypothetical protein